MTSVIWPRIAALSTVLFVGACASSLPAIDLDPTNTGNSVPAQKYQSVFANYRGFAEAAPIPWRRANERAARMGGHVGILKAPADANAEDTDD